VSRWQRRRREHGLASLNIGAGLLVQATLNGEVTEFTDATRAGDRLYAASGCSSTPATAPAPPMPTIRSIGASLKCRRR
jgi:hypothetical protein